MSSTLAADLKFLPFQKLNNIFVEYLKILNYKKVKVF